MPAWFPPVNQTSVFFALRTTVASMVALYLAFLMSMDDPKWAAMTVWIVAQQSRGMSRSKAVFRVCGTVTGAVVAFSLIALFAQSPLMLFVGLAIWIAGCVGLATGLRDFRAYGAVLAGYTAAIVSLDAAARPQNIFMIALSRGSYILLGVVCEGVAAAVFSLATPERDLRVRLSAFIADAARACVRAVRGESAVSAAMRKLFADALALESVASYAAAVSSDSRAMVRTVRYIAGTVLEQLAAAQAISEHPARIHFVSNAETEAGPDAAPLLESAASALEKGATVLTYGTQPEQRQAWVSNLADLRRRIGVLFPTHTFEQAAVLDRLDMLLASTQLLASAVEQTSSSWLAPFSKAPLRFSFVFDRAAALRNGIRAFTAVLLAAFIWVESAWTTGAGFVTITGVVCALFATRPNPTAGSWAFFRGAVAAALAAACCNFLILPAASGFVWLMLALTPFLFVGGLALRNPRTAGAAAGFTIFILDLVGPQNQSQVSDPTSFLNGALTLCAGIAFGALIFHLIVPSGAAAVRARWKRAILRDLERLAVRPARFSRVAWLGRIADGVGRQLGQTAGVAAQQTEADFRFALAALELGEVMMFLSGAASALSEANAAAPSAPSAPETASTATDGAAQARMQSNRQVIDRTCDYFQRRMSALIKYPKPAARIAELAAKRLAFAAHLTRQLLEAETNALSEQARLQLETQCVQMLQVAQAFQRAAEALQVHVVISLKISLKTNQEAQ